MLFISLYDEIHVTCLAVWKNATRKYRLETATEKKLIKQGNHKFAKTKHGLNNAAVVHISTITVLPFHYAYSPKLCDTSMKRTVYHPV